MFEKVISKSIILRLFKYRFLCLLCHSLTEALTTEVTIFSPCQKKKPKNLIVYLIKTLLPYIENLCSICCLEESKRLPKQYCCCPFLPKKNEDKTMLLKIPNTSDSRFGWIDLDLTWKPAHWCLALIVLERAIQATIWENN